ncbi:MAG TPA: hypothetical protein VLG37_02835 [Candidatus Saccharimonadales bacterium]|nr:hypothetical protein [Candidatus Saccharimonadales bacterium]
MNLKTLTNNPILNRDKRKINSKSWLATTAFSILATLVLGLGMVQPALADTARCRPDGGPYDCQVMSEYPRGWHNVTSLTYCFPTKNKVLKWANGNHQGYPLPATYQDHVNAGANTWSTTPGLQVKLSPTACTSKTDIRIYAVHLGNKAGGELGSGACASYDSGPENDYCAANAGQMEFNIDVPSNDSTATVWLHATIHEFGHVLGLQHPMASPCNNKCGGPVMSYGSCPGWNDCSDAPNYDDIAGIQQVYRWPASPNGGGGCNLLTTTGTSSSTGIQSYLTDPVIATTPLPDPNSLTIPDPGTLVPTVSDPVATLIAPTVNVTSVPDPNTLVSSVEDLIDSGPDFVAVSVPPSLIPADTGSAINGALDTIQRLADPRVDAYETLVASGGAIRNEMDWVFMTTGVPVSSSDLPQTCL